MPLWKSSFPLATPSVNVGMNETEVRVTLHVRPRESRILLVELVSESMRLSVKSYHTGFNLDRWQYELFSTVK